MDRVSTAFHARFTETLPTSEYNTHHRHDSVELSHVGDVNAPVCSRDPDPVFINNCLCRWAIEISDKWRHNDVIVEKVSISIKIQVVINRYGVCLISFQIVHWTRRQSSWASCEFCSHRRRRRDSTRLYSTVELSRVKEY